MKSPTGKRSRKTVVLLVVAVLLLAGALRLINLSQADVLTDEGSLGFRALGFLDFLASPYQTTPLEWVNDRPWWFHLSFHDHPIGFFILQNFSFKLFGPSVFALRLPSAFLGILSVLMVFLIGKKLLDDKLGLLAAGLLAVNDFHIWVSRLGLQESAAIFFTLLAFWLWLKSGEKPKYLLLFGLAFGAALMIKIHAVILVPLVLLHAYIFNSRRLFKRKEFYLGLLITFVVTAPYWLYNLFMYARFEHFDFQFSYLLGQKVDAWQIRPGRFEFPDKVTAFRYFFLNLKDSLSPAFLLAGIGGMLYTLTRLARKTFYEPAKRLAWFFLLTLLLYFLFFLFLGPSTRFLTLLTPWLCLIIAFAINHALLSVRGEGLGERLGTRLKFIAFGILALFFAYELFFSITTNLTPQLSRSENLLYSHLTQLTKPYGYNQLDDALNKILTGKKPAATLPIVNKNLNNFVKKNAAKQPGEPAAIMMIYDPRLYGESVLWFLSRRMYYQGWPVLDYDVYHEALKTNGQDFFKKALGLTDFYYIAPTGSLPLDPSVQTATPPEKLAAFEQSLKAQNAETQIVVSAPGQPVFTIYRFR